MLTQKEKSGDVGCYYRFEKEDGRNLSCAAGCLISDEEMKRVIDNNANNSAWPSLISQGIAPGNNMRFIVKLQSIHDTESVKNWRNLLIDLGLEYNLDISFIDSIPE